MVSFAEHIFKFHLWWRMCQFFISFMAECNILLYKYTIFYSSICLIVLLLCLSYYEQCFYEYMYKVFLLQECMFLLDYTKKWNYWFGWIFMCMCVCVCIFNVAVLFYNIMLKYVWFSVFLHWPLFVFVCNYFYYHSIGVFIPDFYMDLYRQQKSSLGFQKYGYC